MIQNGTFLNVIDNSGAKIAFCIRVVSGCKKQYAFVGDILLVSIKTLRAKRRSTSKVKKGELYRAVLISSKTCLNLNAGESLNFFTNSIVLLNKQNKLIASRITSPVPKTFRYTKFLKIASISSGLFF